MNGQPDRPRAARRAPKSATAFRTISEVAEELDVPAHVLRFWETKFDTVQPLKRGGGRRYYRPEDIALLRGIRTLLYDDGYTIKGVQRLLREHGGRLPAETDRIANDGGRVGPVEASPSAVPEEKLRDLHTVLSELKDLRALLDSRLQH